MYLDTQAVSFLRTKIKKSEFSQKDLAFILEITPSVLSKQLRGEISIPRQRVDIIVEKLNFNEDEELEFNEMLDNIELRENLAKQETKTIGPIEPGLEALMNIWRLLTNETKKKILSLASESLVTDKK